MNLHNILQHFFSQKPHRSIHGADIRDSGLLRHLADGLQAACTPTPLQELAQWAADNSNSEITCMLTITNVVRLHVLECQTEECNTLFRADMQAAYFNREILQAWLNTARQQIDEFYLEYENANKTEPQTNFTCPDGDEHTGSLHIEQRGQSHINITINFR